MMSDDRGAVQLADGIMTFTVMVSLLALSPIIFQFTGMVTESADALSAMVLRLVVPFFFIAIIISVGISARRRV